MTTYGLGHNSGALPTPVDTSADLPRDIPRMHYFKCDIDALWDVLIEMPLELGGFYMRAILAMYKHMEGLPADDDVARMRLGGMDARTYRRLKAALLARPKCLIEKPSGRISNARFEEEITAYITTFKNRRDAALERESKKRKEEAQAPTSEQLPSKVGPKLDQSPAKVAEISAKTSVNIIKEISKKPNEINGHHTTILTEADHSGEQSGGLRARVIRSRTREEGRESESLPQTQSLELRLSEAGGSDVVQKKPYSEDFENFWASYPDRTNNSKLKAWQAWRQLTAVERQRAFASLPAFTRYCRSNPTYRCVHAERYLRDRRFESEFETGSQSNGERPFWMKPDLVAKITVEKWRNAIAKHANGVWPVDMLGPAPGSPGCVIPNDLIVELRLIERYAPNGSERQPARG